MAGGEEEGRRVPLPPRSSPPACSGHPGVCCHILSSCRHLQDTISIFQPPHYIIFSHLYPPPLPHLQKRKANKKKRKESLAGQWTASAMALPDLPAGLLRAALSSEALEKEAPSSGLPSPSYSPTHSPTSLALKQLCRPGSERGCEKHTERKGREFQWPSGNSTSLKFSHFFIPEHSLLLFCFFSP